MIFTKIPFYLLFLTLICSLAFANCPSSPIHITQEFSTFEYLTWNLFTRQNLNSTDFISSYGSYSIVTPGNSFCLDSDFYNSAYITPKPSDSLWSLWQTYGLVYGYTFNEFVISNLIENNGGVGSSYDKSMRASDLSGGFNAYEKNDLSKSGNLNLDKIYLNSIFDLDYQSNLSKVNSEIIASVSSNKKRNIGFLLTSLEPSDIPNYNELSTNLSDLSKLNLDIKVIIYNQNNLDKSSISLATYSNLIYSLEFTSNPRLNKPADYDPILILISPNKIFSISFLPDSPFLDYDPNFFFDLINIGTNHIKDSKDISFILKDISLKLKLSKELTNNPDTPKNKPLLSQIKENP
jgi:hypothetical protein